MPECEALAWMWLSIDIVYNKNYKQCHVDDATVMKKKRRYTPERVPVQVHVSNMI